MIKIKPNTAISVAYKKTTYDANKGTTEEWVKVEYSLSKDGAKLSLFPVQWINAYGGELITAQSLGIRQHATIRMGFNPSLYEKLMTAEVKIFKGNLTADDTAFMLFGSADNIDEKNQALEFKVQRYEVK